MRIKTKHPPEYMWQTEVWCQWLFQESGWPQYIVVSKPTEIGSTSGVVPDIVRRG